MKYTTQNLWDPAKYKGGDKFNGWEEFRKAGVWNSAPYPYRKRWSDMKTKTKKFEFYSETLKAALEEHAKKHNTTVDDILEVSGYQARGEIAFIPHYEEPSTLGDEKEYPFLFVDHKSRLNREGRSANCTWYQEFKDVDPGDATWDDVAKINPVDANKLGLKNGDQDPHHLPDRQARMHGQAVGRGPARNGGQVLRPGPLGVRPGRGQGIRQGAAGRQQQRGHPRACMTG